MLLVPIRHLLQDAEVEVEIGELPHADLTTDTISEGSKTDEVWLICWLVNVWDRLNKGDLLCEVESDKTTMDVESFVSGIVLQLYGKPDTIITSGTVIALLGK